MHCRNCGATSHNIIGCQSALASNRWQQRAQDRELSLDSSPKPSISGSGDLDGSSGLEALEDRRFRREMDQYDDIMARAHEIAKRDR
jgi:hypothetical protein